VASQPGSSAQSKQASETLGAHRVRVVVQDGSETAEAFWTERGFEPSPVRLFGRDL
jgi:hypothetical protein